MYFGYSNNILMPVKNFNSNVYFGTRYRENGDVINWISHKYAFCNKIAKSNFSVRVF